MARGEVGEPVAAAEIAHHYLEVGDAATAALAVRWGRAAADQARIETAFEGAVWFLGRAVEVHDAHGGDPDGRRVAEVACELRLELAEAHDRAGDFTARDGRHLEAAELARSLGRTDLFTRAALGYGGRLPAAPPSNPEARDLLEQVLDRLPATDTRARALATARLAHVRHGDAPHAERRALADEAEAMARRLDAPVVLASVLCSRVLALDGPDDLDEHLDIGAEVMRIGEQTGDQDLVLQGARARIHPLFVVGAHDAARDLADRVHPPGRHGPPPRPPAAGRHVADHVGRPRGPLRRGRGGGRRAAPPAGAGRALAGRQHPRRPGVRAAVAAGHAGGGDAEHRGCPAARPGVVRAVGDARVGRSPASATPTPRRGCCRRAGWTTWPRSTPATTG